MPYNATEYMRPSELYYTQDSIGVRFTDGNWLSDVYYDIIAGDLNPNEDIPPLTVVYHDGKPFVLGCRRLYIYKKLEELDVIRKVIVEISTPERESHRFYKLLTTQNGGTSIELRGRFRKRRAHVYPWEFYRKRYHYENWTKSEQFKTKNRRNARSESRPGNQRDQQSRARSVATGNDRQPLRNRTNINDDQTNQQRANPVVKTSRQPAPSAIPSYDQTDQILRIQHPRKPPEPTIPSIYNSQRPTAYTTPSHSTFIDIHSIRQDDTPQYGRFDDYTTHKENSDSCCAGCTIL